MIRTRDSEIFPYLWAPKRRRRPCSRSERESFIDNLLVRIHFIIVMVRWTGIAPWEFEFPFPGSLTSTFLVGFTQGSLSQLLKRGTSCTYVPRLRGDLSPLLSEKAVP